MQARGEILLISFCSKTSPFFAGRLVITKETRCSKITPNFRYTTSRSIGHGGRTTSDNYYLSEHYGSRPDNYIVADESPDYEVNWAHVDDKWSDSYANFSIWKPPTSPIYAPEYPQKTKGDEDAKPTFLGYVINTLTRLPVIGNVLRASVDPLYRPIVRRLQSGKLFFKNTKLVEMF